MSHFVKSQIVQCAAQDCRCYIFLPFKTESWRRQKREKNPPPSKNRLVENVQKMNRRYIGKASHIHNTRTKWMCKHTKYILAGNLVSDMEVDLHFWHVSVAEVECHFKRYLFACTSALCRMWNFVILPGICVCVCVFVCEPFAMYVKRFFFLFFVVWIVSNTEKGTT